VFENTSHAKTKVILKRFLEKEGIQKLGGSSWFTEVSSGGILFTQRGNFRFINSYTAFILPV
jgi:flagellar hook protein FlgE